jgi:hypothetical protein
MASAGRFSRASQESALGALVDKALLSTQGGPTSTMNDLDFIESPQGMNVSLYPIQRVIVKAIFGIPMDYKEGKVQVWDVMHQELRYEFSETEYLKWKFEEGTGNVEDWRDMPSTGFTTACLYAGRRGGKSVVVSAIGAAKLRRLLMIRDPQEHYKLRPGSFIDFTLMGTDEDSSTRLYDKMRSDVCGTAFFAPYLKGNTESMMTFVTEADRDRMGTVPSIQVASLPCTSNSVRGPSSYFLALDEFAFFRSSKTSNSDEMYKAATPSTSNFPNKENPNERDSHILLISSPGQRLGKMYEIHRQAMDQGIASNIFTLNCYTAEMNPGLPASALQDELKQNPESFPVEFGGKFREGAGSFVPDVQIDNCIDMNRYNITRFTPDAYGRKYFWALDLGMKHDGTALGIGHLQLTEGKGIELVIDYIDRMMVGEQFTGPGVKNAIPEQKYVEHTELRIEDIVDWLVYMHQILPCFMGATDQGGGVQLKQLLQLNGITKMELIHITPEINSQMYFALRGFVGNGNARFPNELKFLREFRQLEAEYISKHKLRVAAPNEKGAHDDMGDCVATIAYLASKWLEEDGHLDTDPTARVLLPSNLISPSPLLDPSSLSIRDLKSLSTMQRHFQANQLPPGVITVKDPYKRR